MPVIDERKQPSGAVEDQRSKLRWSADKKMDADLRLLRGEPLHQLSRELEVEAHRLAAWPDDLLEHGRDGSKASRADRDDATERRLKQAERKVGDLNPSGKSGGSCL